MYIYWYIMVAQIGYRYYPWDLDVEGKYKTVRKGRRAWARGWRMSALAEGTDNDHRSGAITT